MRLGLAYEYDPRFSLSIARVDPLPHQLEAVYDNFIKLTRIRFLLADDPGARKTHSLTLLYHLANSGAKAEDWVGVPRLLQAAGLKAVPVAKMGVFVGTEFNPMAGRGARTALQIERHHGGRSRTRSVARAHWSCSPSMSARALHPAAMSSARCFRRIGRCSS
jgi:hypothetical protein